MALYFFIDRNIDKNEYGAKCHNYTGQTGQRKKIFQLSYDMWIRNLTNGR